MNLARLCVVAMIALLVAVALLPAAWHLPLGIAGWTLLRCAARDVHRTIGRPWRWLQGLVALCALGALFGTVDAHVLSIGWSKTGALSGASMIVRAFALVALTSLASSSLPARQWMDRIRHPAARRLIEVVVVAANLVPVQLRALSVASNTLKERRPGLHRLPTRLWLLAVHSALRAAILAESVAFDMAIASHNACGGPSRKESS
jgi:hypothetical protein